MSLFHITRLSLAIALIAASLSEQAVVKRDGSMDVENNVVNPTLDPAKQPLWDPTAGPQPKDVAQGTNGDCWYDAAIASYAHVQPSLIQSIFSDLNNKGGVVTISLWAGNTPYTTQVKKWVAFQRANPKQNDALQWVWPNTLGDAFQNLAKDHPELGISTSLDSGYAMDTYKAISGPNAQTTYLETASTEDDAWWDAWSQVTSRPSTACTKSGPGADLANGIPENHCYTCMDSDENAGTVTLRNPWGMVSQDPTWGTPTKGGKGVTDLGDGTFSISFDDFKTYFEYFAAVQTS